MRYLTLLVIFLTACDSDSKNESSSDDSDNKSIIGTWKSGCNPYIDEGTQLSSWVIYENTFTESSFEFLTFNYSDEECINEISSNLLYESALGEGTYQLTDTVDTISGLEVNLYKFEFPAHVVSTLDLDSSDSIFSGSEIGPISIETGYFRESDILYNVGKDHGGSYAIDFERAYYQQ